MKPKILGLVLALGIVVRIVLSLTTYHSDLGAFSLAGKYIAGEGKWFTFYDTIASKDSTGAMVTHRTDMAFIYQPLAYLIPSVVYLPFSGIVRQTGEIFLNHEWTNNFPSNFNFLLLLYKLPMLLADIGILFLLPKFFTKQSHKRIAQILWAFNPLAILVSSMMGQVDIIIALLILVSLYFAKNNKLVLASIFVALSALIKPIGLILIPIYIIHQFHQNKNILKSLLVGAAGLGVYVLGILPFIGSASYRYYALFADLINKSTYAAISIAAGHDIPLFFILFIIVVLTFWSKRISLTQAVAATLLSSLAFTHFHPQWLVWLMPLFIILAIDTEDYLFYAASILCWLIILFSFDSSLHLQLFFHSQLSLPSSLTSSNLFKEAIQLSRAGLIGILIWFIGSRQQVK